MCVDLSDWAATRKAVEEIGPVDLLVNNAAILRLTAFLEVEEAEISEYERSLFYNLSFTYLTNQFI